MWRARGRVTSRIAGETHRAISVAMRMVRMRRRSGIKVNGVLRRCDDGHYRTAPVGNLHGEQMRGDLHDVHWATYGSGWRIVGTAVIQVRLRTGLRGSVATALSRVLRGGSWFFESEEPPRRETATGAPPALGSAAAVSVLPGRLRLESLRLYLICGGRGLMGGVDFSDLEINLERHAHATPT